SIWFGCVLRGDVNKIRIGAGTNLQDGTIVHGNHDRAGDYRETGGGMPTIIGDNVVVGHQAMLHACTLQDGAFVGMAAVVMDQAVVEPGAMVAAGALRDPALLPRYEALLAPKEGDAVAPGDPVTVAAAWGVARMGDRRALPLLARMLDSASPDVRAFGALGYGLSKDRAAPAKLEALLASPDVTSSNVRAAAALGLGEAGARASTPALLALASGPDPFVRSAAYVALARLGDPAVAPAVAPALFALDAAERQVAASALVALATKDPLRPAEPLPVQGGAVESREALRGLFLKPPATRARVQTLVGQADVIARAAAVAASSSPERAAAVAESLSSGRGAPGRAALVPLL
ncbi:MAG TPA: HEAT repeat domain-containing protein, partial [Polyangiaceae bacterium]|nr:HEAT repeat domain-containing protein [Polyangiaceae bacterium]